MAKPGEPVVICPQPMRATFKAHLPIPGEAPSPLRVVESTERAAWPPLGYEVVAVPIALAYQLVKDGKALPCDWKLEGE